jgi:hypothetical protein
MRTLYVKHTGHPYRCTEEDIAHWNSLNPTREHELKLMELLEADRKRDLREAMRLSVAA